MQKIETARELQQRLTVILETVQREFVPLTDAQLRWKASPDRWSVLECLQHLNLAERFYIRNLQHKVDRLGLVQTNPVDQLLESDWLGKVMLYNLDPESRFKLPTPGIVRPRHPSELDPADVLIQFTELQTLLRELLNKAVYLDWNKDKMTSLFGNWLKIRLADALRMLVAHTERHIDQAMRVKAEMATFAPDA